MLEELFWDLHWKKLCNAWAQIFYCTPEKSSTWDWLKDWCRRLKLISYCCSASANQIFLRLLLQTLVDCLVPFCVACTPLWLAVASLASVRIVVLCYMLCSYAGRMLHEHSNILSVSNLLSLAWHSHGSIVCVWFVVAHKKNADIQLILLMLKQNPTAYCHQPSFSFHCTNVLIPIYIRSARQHSFDFYIDVCSFRPNCHACIFSVLYGVLELFINKIMFYLKDTFVWGTHGSFKLRCFFFLFVLFCFLCGRTCVCMPCKNLHIFKSFLDEDSSCFFTV